MRVLLSSIVAGLLCSLAAAQPLTNVCHYSPQPGVTFDVCALSSSSNDYVWTDPTDFETTNSTYTFNIASNVVNKPAACAGNISNAPAFQVVSGTDCYRLGMDTTKSRYMAFNQQLFDASNPARGWMLTYTTGDFVGCPTGVARSLSLMFICGHRPFPAPGPVVDTHTFVNEVNSCQYEAYSVSTAGCPLECPIVNGELCSGNGVCGYDSAISQARCFCNSDYLESDCQTPVTPFPSGGVAASTIIGILLGIAGLLFYGWFTNRKASGYSGMPAADAPSGFY